jgi:RHS repeat-associated protein
MNDGSGLTYLRARWYDPATGRFASRDPLIGNTIDPTSLNSFVYARSNPVMNADPSGLDPVEARSGCLADVPTCNPVPQINWEFILDDTSRSVAVNPFGLSFLRSGQSGGGKGGNATPGLPPSGGGPDRRVVDRIIKTFSREAINKGIMSRGVRPYEILDALRNPIEVRQGKGDVTIYVGQFADVRVNSDGNVVTMIRFKGPLEP